MRRWSVLFVDDAYEGLLALQSCGVTTISELYETRSAPAWLFSRDNDDWTSGSSRQTPVNTICEHCNDPGSDWPLFLSLGSLADAWTILDEAIKHVEIFFLDVKLDEVAPGHATLYDERKVACGAEKDANRAILQDIQTALSEEHKSSGFNGADLSFAEVAKRGGIYLLGKIHRLLPLRGALIAPKVFICTGSQGVHSESLPFVYSNLFDISLKSGLHGNVLAETIAGRQRMWLSSGHIDIAKIRALLSMLRQAIRNNALPADVEEFLKTEIGAHWTLGSFFWKQSTILCAPCGMFHKELSVGALDAIEKIITSVDYACALTRFITYTHFDVLSHRGDRKCFNKGSAVGKTVDDALTENLISTVIGELKEDWTGTSCCGTAEVRPLEDLLFLNDHEHNTESVTRLCDAFAVAKNALRIDPGTLWSYIWNSFRSTEVPGQNVSLEILARTSGYSAATRCESGSDFLRVFSAVNNAKVALPARDLTNRTSNILGDLLGATFAAIREHGFSGCSSGNVKVTCWFDSDECTWRIVLSQSGGSQFVSAKLSDPWFFVSDRGGLRQILCRVKYWVDVEIRSGKQGRNPHLQLSDAIRYDPVMIECGSVVEFDYTIRAIM